MNINDTLCFYYTFLIILLFIFSIILIFPLNLIKITMDIMLHLKLLNS